MSKVVVVYHSGYGHTQRVAQFVSDGAGAELIAIDADGNLTGWKNEPARDLPASLGLADAASVVSGSHAYLVGGTTAGTSAGAGTGSGF